MSPFAQSSTTIPGRVWRDQLADPFRRFRAALTADTGLWSWMLVTLLAVVAAVVAYTMITGNVWEDFLITLRFGQNLVEGNGLVYYPGERVHGFTSVINTLLPVVFLKLGDVENFRGALAGYRVFSVLALLGGLAVLLYALSREKDLSRTARWAFSALLAFDFKLVAFTSNGMESGFLVGFLAVALAIALRGTSRYWLIAGLAWAGLLYTRPDTPLYIGLLSLFSIWLHRETRKAELAGLLKAAAVCTLLYLPWLLWVWSYYGSPIPHTITAKAAYSVTATNKAWFYKLTDLWANLPMEAARVFLPVYADPRDWWMPGTLAALLAAVAAAFAWLWNRADRVARGLSVVFVALLCYFSFLQVRLLPFPWYFPPATLIGSVVLARGLAGRTTGLRRWGGRILVLGLIGALAANWWFGVRCIRIQQKEVEYGNRMLIGLWLKDHVRTGETVFLEPLGYIGYFSRAQMRDYPGLVSPETVTAIRSCRGDLGSTALALQPDWLVLREWEETDLLARPGFTRQYECVIAMSARARLAAYGRFWGDSYPNTDAFFAIYHRRSALFR
jgi:hypothetical protein